MSKREPKRQKIRKRDGDRCFYCDLPMMPYGMTKAEWLKKFNLERNCNGGIVFCRKSKETIEHLEKKADGGGNDLNNLVLAHHLCNTLREDRTPDQHKEWIKGEIKNPLSALYVIKNYYREAG